MIKCGWLYCKYNQITGICSCVEDIVLRRATSQDLIDEGIIDKETEGSIENCSSVLICDNYECME